MFDALTQAVLPCKPPLWRRLSALPLLSYYNRLFALVISCNVGVIVLGSDVRSMGVESLSTMVLINLSLATLRTAIQAAKSRSFIQRPAWASKRFCSCAAP